MANSGEWDPKWRYHQAKWIPESKDSWEEHRRVQRMLDADDQAYRKGRYDGV